MRTSLYVLGLALSLGAVGCSQSPVGVDGGDEADGGLELPTDGGTTAADGGTTTPDSGTTAQDAGTRTDAGVPTTDGGVADTCTFPAGAKLANARLPAGYCAWTFATGLTD